MSLLHDNQIKMFKRYKQWLQNENEFTKEVAAFEYMKRNPYFISIAYLYKKNLCSPMGIILSPISEQMRQLLEHIFLYTGLDIHDNIRKECDGVKLNYKAKKKYRNYGDMKDALIKYNATGNNNYYYTNMYVPLRLPHGLSAPDECKKVSKSAQDAKKENPIDLNIFHKEGRSLRWLEHLLPSMYVKINPYMKQDDLKSALTNLIRQISNDDILPDSGWRLADYAVPDVLLDNNSDATIDLKAPTFQSLKSAVALIMYDFLNIFQIKDPKKIKKFLSLCIYPDISAKAKQEFEKYFNVGGKTQNYQGVVFETRHIKTTIYNAKSRINGGYLDYIYPYKSKRLHQKHIIKEYKKIYSSKYIIEQKAIIMDASELLHPNGEYDYLGNYTGIIQLQCYSAKEYEQWSHNMFALLNDDDYSNSIFSILLFFYNFNKNKMLLKKNKYIHSLYIFIFIYCFYLQISKKYIISKRINLLIHLILRKFHCLRKYILQ